MNQLTFTQWRQMAGGEREDFSRQLISSLPYGFAFRGLVRYELGSHAHEMALFDHGEATFVLVLAAEVSLGYHPDRRWEPTHEELASWQNTSQHYGYTCSIQEHIAAVTLKPRTAHVGAMLVETCPQELGWETISPDAPEIRDDLEKARPYLKDSPGVNLKRESHCVRISRNDSGGLTVKICRYPTHEKLCSLISASGFRFPTADEWEYLCGAGASTLFRWGDHAPCDCYPIGKKSEETGWDLHRGPNSFGLHIASNPYKCELLNDPAQTRGGDGGFAICGGTGFFVGWLPLATAYFEEHACKRDPAALINPEYTVGRRVLPLP